MGDGEAAAPRARRRTAACCARHKIEIEEPPRTVFFNHPFRNAETKYARNRIRTTKYNVFTFLPKNLYEQFRRVANLYFLLIMILQLIPGLSPVSPITTILPLVLVLGVTAIKEAVEDYRRYKRDREINRSTCHVLRDNAFQEAMWQDLVIGDIVMVLNDEHVPADMMLITTSEPSGMAYIETANLDGETNLKIYQAPQPTWSFSSPASMSSLKGEIECEGPNKRIYKFLGTLSLDGSGAKFPLTKDQVILRGTTLKNTKAAYGCVVYTGHDTKLMRNATKAPSKRTRLERVLNKQVLFMFLVQFGCCFVMATLAGVWSGWHYNDWYLFGVMQEHTPAANGGLAYISFLILFNVMIPISLYVSIEFVKIVQISFISGDLEMYDETSDCPAEAHTSNLNEDLGQVSYVFSDKTGTLTRNLMEFKKCTVAGVWYGDPSGAPASSKPLKRNVVLEKGVNFYDPKLLENLVQNHQTAPVIHEFLTVLSVCHSILPEVDPTNAKNVLYRAASPDELALVRTAKMLGFYFHTRRPGGIVVNIMGHDFPFQILAEIPFSSERKRMSVIVRDPSGHLRLFCKGADSVIFSRLRGNQRYLDITRKHCDMMARDGLRTLCLATATLDPAEYAVWSQKWEAASLELKDRDEKMAAVGELIERNLDLIGATAIEDKLQAGVPEALQDMLDGHIRVWVLTGDKQETAINIGYSSNLIQEDFQQHIINCTTREATLAKIEKASSQTRLLPPSKKATLIIDGDTLLFALDRADHLMRMSFLQLAQMCHSVVCCRVSASQKAEIVRLVRDNGSYVTLAIGDGANDVSMIQAAHVGVGITGQEGLQAARAADFAIAQFRFLRRLLFVHGQLSYERIAKMVTYFFYKNMTMVLTMMWFNFFTGFSAQPLFDSWYISLYNVVFTSLPVIALGMFNRDVRPAALTKYPQLYRKGQHDKLFSAKLVWLWIGEGVLHSLAIFFLCYAIYYNEVSAEGRDYDLWEMGLSVYSCIIIVVNLRLALETRFWSWANHAATWISIAVVFIFTLLYCNLVSLSWNVYGTWKIIFGSTHYWLSIIIIPIIVLLPDFAYHYISWNYHPTPGAILHEMIRLKRVPLTSFATTAGAADARHSLPQATLTGTDAKQFRTSARLSGTPLTPAASSSSLPGFGALPPAPGSISLLSTIGSTRVGPVNPLASMQRADSSARVTMNPLFRHSASSEAVTLSQSPSSTVSDAWRQSVTYNSRSSAYTSRTSTQL